MSQVLIYTGYFFLLMILFFERIKGFNGIKKIIQIFIIAFLAFLVSITQFAMDVGTYRRIYERLISAPDQWRLDLFPEYGFQYLNYLFNGVFGQEFEVFRFFFASATMLVTLFSVRLLTKNTGIFFYLYFAKYLLVGVVSHVRSAFIYPFLIVVAYLAEKKKNLIIFLLSLVLSQIHITALMFNLVFLFQYVRLNKFIVLAVIPLSILTKFLFFPVFQDLLLVIELRQVGYFYYDGDSPQSVFGIEFLKRLFVIALVFYIVAYQGVSRISEDIVLKMFLLSVFIYIGFSEAKFISDRVGGLFGFVEPLIFIYLFEKLRSQSNKLIFFLVILTYGGLDFFLRGFYLNSLPSHFPVL